MASFLPIKLVGDSLGKRHQQLNFFVNEAYKQQIPFDSIVNIEEQTPLDRIFKINLASRYKNVEYVLKNLKEEDMLFVSYALKSTWLLEEEYVHIINPVYLEDVLFPDMTTTAATKMKNWMQHNLKDPTRSEEFYEYYHEKDLNLSIRFLLHCSNDFVLNKFKDVMDKIKPSHFKIIIEHCPDAAKVFFDSLKCNEKIKLIYTNKEEEFFSGLKTLLKTNPTLYLDIVEEYYNIDDFGRMSSEATKFIIENHKSRFIKKAELYTAYLLDMKTLAKLLNADEIKDLILKLAQASYLSSWFEFKKIEPLIKALKADERGPFKNKVFVKKDIGQKVEKWPYEIPKSPSRTFRDTSNIFTDAEDNPQHYLDLENIFSQHLRMCVPRSCRIQRKYCAYDEAAKIWKRKTSLDALFEIHRFDSFEKTFSELKKSMLMADSKKRQNMMLVLVSKTGGRLENLEEVIKLLVKHENEPDNLRATIVRSLVRRSCVWRVPQHVWDSLMIFAHDIGLDGKDSTVPCKEGVHAIVLRRMLEGVQIESAIWNSYIKDFSDFKEYSLNNEEKQLVKSKLPDLLLSAAETLLESSDSTEISKSIEVLGLVIHVNQTYRLSFENPRFNETLAKAVKKDKVAEKLVKYLFDNKINRKAMFKENFAVIQDNASYLNALKHNIEILESAKEFEILVEKGKLAHDMFLQKLALYFNEENGLAGKYLDVLVKALERNPLRKNARPTAILAGKRILSIIKSLDNAPEHSDAKKFAAVLRSNAHRAKPLVCLDVVDWRWLGAKAVTNRKLKISKMSVDDNIDKLLTWSKTTKLAVLLAMRTGKEAEVLAKFAERRPNYAFRIVVKHWSPSKSDAKVWDVLIPLIPKINTSKLTRGMKSALVSVKVPKNVEPQYYSALHALFKNDSKHHACAALCYLQKILHDVDSKSVEDILVNYINDEFNLDLFKRHDLYEGPPIARQYIKVIAKFLLLSKNEMELKDRLEKIGAPFLKKIEEMEEQAKVTPEYNENRNSFRDFSNTFMKTLKYNNLFLKSQDTMPFIVLEKIVECMQTIWPLELHFEKYVYMHLTMLYFKSIRNGMKNNPEVFENLSENVDNATEITGIIFGKYIAREIVRLIDKYFDSIKHLYKEYLYKYLSHYFLHDDNRRAFIAAIVRGILSEENSKAHVLAERLYGEVSYGAKLSFRNEISVLLKQSNNEEVHFFLYANRI